MNQFIHPSLWGRDHWSTIAYAFTRAGRPLDPDKLRGHPANLMVRLDPSRVYATRLATGAFIGGHTDLDCLDDAEAAGVLRHVGNELQPCVEFTREGLVLGQWLTSEANRGALSGLTWTLALEGSGAKLGEATS